MPSAPPSVLALHGFTGGGADFAPLALALPEWTWRTPNLPGHAPDPAVPGAPGDDCHPAACIQYLDTISPTPPGVPAVLLGYSLGGRLALRHALAHPGRWAALVLIATSPGLADPRERAVRQTEDERLAAEILAHGVPTFLEQWQRRPLIATQSRIPANWRNTMQARRLRLRAAGLAASLRQFGQGAVPPVWDRLPELRLPVLLVAGAEDPAYVALAKAMRDQLPSADLLIVPNAGHMAHLENLPAFVQGLRRFLQAHGLALSET
jgi:2-succinyl-5-enolpyruvyl-6-hydroxy-3-cyclohexene-1-carboxylate synthase/2-succinyl-6-hydroxy-2,4-cyclohexadiene-1-carboxylate synthase